jgi:hypothetical protein
VIWFRHADRRYPFLWDTSDQPAARWHDEGEGPAQYLASTSDGAWAEFIRREEISDPADLAGIERALWAVAVDEDREAVGQPRLSTAVLSGGLDSYPACRREARRLRDAGATALRAPSAALHRGGARGQRVAGGLDEAPDEDGRVLVLFGRRPGARGWVCCASGRPAERLLGLVRPLRALSPRPARRRAARRAP